MTTSKDESVKVKVTLQNSKTFNNIINSILNAWNLPDRNGTWRSAAIDITFEDHKEVYFVENQKETVEESIGTPKNVALNSNAIPADPAIFCSTDPRSDMIMVGIEPNFSDQPPQESIKQTVINKPSSSNNLIQTRRSSRIQAKLNQTELSCIEEIKFRTLKVSIQRMHAINSTDDNDIIQLEKKPEPLIEDQDLNTETKESMDGQIDIDWSDSDSVQTGTDDGLCRQKMCTIRKKRKRVDAIDEEKEEEDTYVPTPLDVILKMVEEGRIIEFQIARHDGEDGTKWRARFNYGSIVVQCESVRKVLARQGAAFELIKLMKQAEPQSQFQYCAIPVSCYYDPFLPDRLVDLVKMMKLGRLRFENTSETKFNRIYFTTICYNRKDKFIGSSFINADYSKILAAKAAYETYSGSKLCRDRYYICKDAINGIKKIDCVFIKKERLAGGPTCQNDNQPD